MERVELCRSFALAVARSKDSVVVPGIRGGLIDHAAAFGIPFMVEVAPTILALHADPESADDAEAFAENLRASGVPAVMVASGDPSHRHLFVPVKDSTKRRTLRREAEAAGFEARRVIRPPLSPPLSTSELLLPTDSQEALRDLQSAR